MTLTQQPDKTEPTYEVSANLFIEAQTQQIEREFGQSRPQPRNWAMGFNGIRKKKRDPLDIWDV